MKLSEGIEQYVARKRAGGFAFEHGESYLLKFSRIVGDILLSQVKPREVSIYLDEVLTSTVTWRLKYQVLTRFFEYWTLRGMMSQLTMPPPKSPVRQIFIPYILTRAELRVLFRTALRVETPTKHVSPPTLRTFLILLYGTGAFPGEVINLKLESLNLQQDLITIGKRSRQIPIGKELREVLQRYIVWRSRNGLVNTTLFVTRDDIPVSQDRIRKDFRGLCEKAGIQRRDGAPHQVRLLDFRFSFAVHRITSWIRNGANLNRLLPALAAYMGQVGLGSTERYLHMTPERFCKLLNKLSPARRRGRWRDNRGLMELLANL